MNIEVVASGILTLLLGVVAYFLKQLLSDFKNVEKDLSEVKNTTSLIKAEFKGSHELTNQKIKFMETRVSRLETQFYNIQENEK